MAGYTPAFSSIYDGTLCGRWPTAVVWASLIPLIDARGHIEMTHAAISARTGWPMDLLRQGIAELELPDPGSRSPAEEGRRLVRLDPHRDWGWRVVNVQKYRDKASGQDQVSDGRNADKVRRYKQRHRQTPADTGRHRESGQDTDSDSDANTDSDKNSEVLSGSSLHLHVSGSSLTQSAQERLKKSSEEESGRERLRALTRSLAESTAIPGHGRSLSPPAGNAGSTGPRRHRGARDRQR